MQLFGISIDSFRIAGGILIVTIAMSMITVKLGKTNKINKKKQKLRLEIALVLCLWLYP
ncbi:MarC family protein [Providencia hangzhouensis]|uniref:MarC family protein n=1 Tax=Providencia hangzhouensis TaxID=3031799 RepID=UPI0034DD2D49